MNINLDTSMDMISKISSGNNGSDKKRYDKKDVIYGSVTDVSSDKVSVKLPDNLGDISFPIGSGKRNDYKVGEEVPFEVEGYKGNSLMLKEMNTMQTESNIISSNVDSKDIYNACDSSEEIEKRKSKSDDESKKEDRIKGSNSLDEGAFEKIDKYMKHIEELSLKETLGIVLDEFGTIETTEDVHIEEADIEDHLDDVLAKYNIKPSQENKEFLKKSLFKFKQIKDMSNKQIAHLACDNESVTLNKAYKEKYSNLNNSDKNKNSLEFEEIENLDEEIKKLLETLDIEVTSENIETSKVLMKEEIDITKLNVSKYNEEKERFEKLDIKEIIGLIASAIKSGNLNDVVFPVKKETLDLKIEDLTEVLNKGNKNYILSNILSEKKNVTIDEIRKYIEVKGSGNKNLEVSEDIKPLADKASDDIIAIRNMLTSKNMQRIHDLGIDIEFMPVSEAREVLSEVSNKEELSENLKVLDNTFKDIEIVRNRDFRVYKDITETTNVTIDYVARKNEEVIKSYESQMIKPNLTLKGELILTERQIGNILEMNNIEQTDINKKCGLILAINDKEINMTNINQIANIENSLDTITERLTPKMTLDLTIEGKNPVTMNIDELTSYIEDYNKQNGDSNNKDLYGDLAKIMNNKSYSKEVKDSIIGIYKMINKINRNQNVGVGKIENLESVTLDDIFEATRVIEKELHGTTIDSYITDDVGLLRDVISKDTNTKDMINSAFKNITSKEEKEKQIELKKINVTEKLEKVGELKEILSTIREDYENITVEEYQKVVDFEDIKLEMPETVKTILENVETKDLRDALDKLDSDRREDNLTSEDINLYNTALKQSTNEVIKAELNREVSEIRIDRLSSAVNSMLEVQEENENIMQLPIDINGESINLNLYFDVDDDKSVKNINISANMKVLGDVLIDLSVNEETNLATIDMKVENKDAIFENREEFLAISDAIGKLGYTVKSQKINGRKITSIADTAKQKINMYNTKFEEVI